MPEDWPGGRWRLPGPLPESAYFVPHRRLLPGRHVVTPKPTLYRWMQRGDLPYEDYDGLTDRHISIEDTIRVKAAKRPGRPKKTDKCEKSSG